MMAAAPLHNSTFPANHAVALLLVINLVFITSFPQPDNEFFPREKRSYEDRRQKELSPAGKAGLGRSAFFATENSTIVVAQIGGTATLPCVVRKFSNGVVSWLRQETPPTLLTVGLAKYTADDRILVEHVRHLQNWGLMIKRVQPSDAGLYECQLSTHPTTSNFVKLQVTEAVAEILGAPDLHLRAGSSLRLVCTLQHSTEPPAYVFWYQEERMINHDPGVQVIPDKASSVLLLQDADKSHNGNYTCKPSNAIPAFINVHVLNATDEENPAAMLDANSSNLSPSIHITILIGLLVNFFLHARRR